MISIINIPDSDSFTDDNDRYFIFAKNPKSVRSKKAPVLLIAMTASFLLGCFAVSIQHICWTAAFAASAYYLYEDRFYYYYNRAASQNMFSRHKQTMKFLNKMIGSSRVFIGEMPLSYYILKSKKLLEAEDTENAGRLADAALAEYEPAAESKYIKGLCLYLDKDYENAKKLWEDAVKTKGGKQLRKAVREMLKNDRLLSDNN